MASRRFACIAVLLLAGVAYWRTLPPRPARAEDTAPPAKTGAPTPLTIPMRDGEILAGDLYLPKTPGKHPCILIMTPYGKFRFATALPDDENAALPPWIDLEHYAYVVVDWRGYFASKNARTGDKNAPMEQQGEDGFDTVEWLAARDWCDGKVGMFGASALGKVQFYTAARQPPHLVCIAPAVAEPGNRYAHYYPGGVLRYAHTHVMDGIGFAGIQAAMKRMPRYSFAWRLLEKRFDYHDITVPVLLIGGWYDTDMSGVFRAFEELRNGGGSEAARDVRLLVGPWTHMGATHGNKSVGCLEFPAAEAESAREALRYFDYHLRGVQNGFDKRPRVRYFQMGPDTWHDSDVWPPLSVTDCAWHLAKDGRLAAQPDAEAATASLTADPARPTPTLGGNNLTRPVDDKPLLDGPRDQWPLLEQKDACERFLTAPLTEPVSLLGQPRLTLTVAIDTPDTDIAVRLCDVTPEGEMLLISDGIQRLRYRDSLEKPKLVEPGEIVRVTVELTPSGWTFDKDHCIGVIITGSNYPRYAVNPNTGADFLEPDGQSAAAKITLHTGDEHQAILTLPITKP